MNYFKELRILWRLNKEYNQGGREFDRYIKSVYHVPGKVRKFLGLYPKFDEQRLD
jgi:hypothetical protein